MLRKLILVALLAAPALLMHPQTAAAAEGFKIGYVDMARALNDVSDGKAAKARLKLEFEAKQKQLDEMQQKLKKKKDNFDKRAAMMKPEARAKKQEELQQEFVNMQQTYVKLQKELMDSEGQLTQEIGERLRAIVERIGDRDGYHAILNIGEAVIYHKRHMDITAEVVRTYDKQHGKK